METPLGAKVTTSGVKGNSVYVGTDKRHLYRLSPADSGEILGDATTSATPYGRLAAAEDSLFAFVGSFNLDLKKLQRSAEASNGWTSARPYLWPDLALVGDRNELIALRWADGSRTWSFQFPKTVPGVGASPDVLYVGTLKGPIFACSQKLQQEE